jgi:glycosyltransferase involved in cell wall biosynthesis
MKSSVYGFALNYHIKYSKSHETLVVNPLKNYLNVQFRQWDGTSEIDGLSHLINRKLPLIFFQYPPSSEIINNSNANIIWIPMWDHIRNHPATFWKGMSKKVKIVAFSKNVENLAEKYGFRILGLKYFSKPEDIDRRKENKRILHYWNRTGLYSPEFITSLCRSLKADVLIFQSSLDPGISEKYYYKMPTDIGNTKIIELKGHLDRKKYEAIIRTANIFLAPRMYEGVGISFLEAISRGSFVIGYDAPTMNEYIVHKQTGFLIKRERNIIPLVKDVINKSLLYISNQQTDSQHHLINGNSRLWDEISELDIEKIKANVRDNNQIGFENWTKHLSEYAEFISQ